MILRTGSLLALTLISGSWDQLPAQRPVPLHASDLRAGSLTVDSDSSTVVAQLGVPASVDSSGFHYRDQVIWFRDGKVAILTLTGPSLATERGLRVGDSRARALALYKPCYSDQSMLQICFREDDFDERAIIVQLEGGKVSSISVGRILEP